MGYIKRYQGTHAFISLTHGYAAQTGLAISRSQMRMRAGLSWVTHASRPLRFQRVATAFYVWTVRLDFSVYI